MIKIKSTEIGKNLKHECNELSKGVKKKKENAIKNKFKPLNSSDLEKILSLTIKNDDENKVVIFLCMLSAYTEDSQFNISLNAPSSTGKSYIPLEIASLFPKEDVTDLGHCSPTAFFHDAGNFDKKFGGYIVNLSRKILIFLDQPHSELLARLRPLLSHDKKEIKSKITDKNQQYGLKTKNILLIGYPSVMFCSARLRMDEQEITRFLLLSPESNQEKTKKGICNTINNDSNPKAYLKKLNRDPDRKLLKERIRAIEKVGINEIIIENKDEIKKRFLPKNKKLKPRHQRDIKRLISIIKVFALLNLWWRERKGSTIVANDDDINQAFGIWEKISTCQNLGIPPYVYSIYNEVILPAYVLKHRTIGTVGGNKIQFQGLSRKEISDKYYQVYGRTLDNYKLRIDIIPVLETAGLITQDKDPNDKRQMLIRPINIRREVELNK